MVERVRFGIFKVNLQAGLLTAQMFSERYCSLAHLLITFFTEISFTISAR